MGTMASQMTGVTSVYSASLAFVTGEFPAQKTSNAENISIWWRHHELLSAIVKTNVAPCCH